MSITNLFCKILPPALLGVFLYVVGGDGWIPEMKNAGGWKWLGLSAGGLWLASIGPRSLGAIAASKDPKKLQRVRFWGVQIAAAGCIVIAIVFAFLTQDFANACCTCAEEVKAGVYYATMHTFLMAGFGLFLLLALAPEQ